MPSPGVSLVDFEQINADWVLVILMTRFARITFTGEILHRKLHFLYSVFNLYYEIASITETLICSEASSVSGLVLCCNQRVNLHWGLVC